MAARDLLQAEHDAAAAKGQHSGTCSTLERGSDHGALTICTRLPSRVSWATSTITA